MASQSRAAQEQLQALEKEAAPFEDQLVEAAKFIGTSLDEVRRFSEDGFEGDKGLEKVAYHGKEEWLLRWLLKRLQAPRDDVPRQTAFSWWLLSYILRSMPLVNVAQILVERRFVSILQLALEEVEKRDFGAGIAVSESSSTEQDSSEKKSKKRKRSGELVAKPLPADPNLLEAIFAAFNCVVECTKVTSVTNEEGRSAAFTAEYMKTVIKTSAEEAAMILGSWLSLCQKALSSNAIGKSNSKNWLTPFIEIWQCHRAKEPQHLQFSLHSTKPLLLLLRRLRRTDQRPHSNWTSQLEVLIARNIIVPAKAAYSTNANLDMLNSLTRISVLQDSANAAIMFEIAIRCVQAPGARKRRRPQDDAWLGTVFKQLKEAMPSRSSNSGAISAMLQSAIDFKVCIDLAVLREITWEYGLPKEVEDWKLVATVLKLDGNTFLIPDEKDLLKELLKRITKASAKASWPDVSELVVSEVVLPLMNEFARARDLSGFIKNWYAQLVEFWKLQNFASVTSYPSNVLSAWEDESLQSELKKLFEPSLTVQQITQILDWLETQVRDYLDNHDDDDPDGRLDAVCVILEAIAGSLSGDESVVDAVGLRLYHIMFNNNASDALSARYKWRSWRILSQSLAWIEHWDIDKLAALWEKVEKPFDMLLKKDTSERLLTMFLLPNYSFEILEILEILAFVCSAWGVTETEKGERLISLVKPVLMEFLQNLAGVYATTLQNISDGDSRVADQIYQPKKCSTDVDMGWAVWSSARCLFVEHPKVLEVGLELDGDLLKDVLQHLFWIASASYDSNQASLEGSKSITMSFPDLWISVMRRESPVFGNKKLTRMIVDTMLKSTTNSDNPLIKTNGNNAFSAHCLHMLRIEDISKSQREQIMKGWPEPESTVLGLPVLALKLKIMRHPAIYEGMRFKDLIELAEALAEADVPRQQDHLALLKELTRLIFVAAQANMDQTRNKNYITEAFKAVQKKVSKARKKKPLNYALVGIVEVALTAFHEKEMTLNDHDIILRDDLENLTAGFKEALMTQLKQLLGADIPAGSQELLAIISIIDAFAGLGVDASRLASLNAKIEEFTATVDGSELNLKARLETFMKIHGSAKLFESDLRGDTSTITGREAIIQRTQAAVAGMDNQHKLGLLQTMIDNELPCLERLDVILAARHVIMSIEEGRGRKDEGDYFTISAAYTILAEHLPKVIEIRQFCLISETLELMLKTKGSSMSQYNIDCTIGGIAILCSPLAPPLTPIHAGTIFTHLCRLLQTILMHHRLKIQGHSHLAEQAMQALLRCLFAPTNPPSSSTITTSKLKFGSPPPWLQPLTLSHAQHFAKLLLLIADPPLSTLSQGRTNPLVSLKDKAKRMSAQWTKYILQEYIYLQLDLSVKMSPDVREALMPGWFAVLETMNESGRDAMRGEMDSGGRAVFRGLFEEWRRVGGRREG